MFAQTKNSNEASNRQYDDRYNMEDLEIRPGNSRSYGSSSQFSGRSGMFSFILVVETRSFLLIALLQTFNDLSVLIPFGFNMLF